MKTNSPKLQIGVIGSMLDQKQSSNLKKIAQEVGSEIATSNALLLFALEKDHGSLSLEAAKQANKVGGGVLAFTWGQRTNNTNSRRFTLVNTGQQRGGGREFAFVLSCDAIISLCGGSGTLMEIAIAYQANIPIIALTNTGGWSSKIAGTFLDKRKRIKIFSANEPKQAVKLALELAALSH